MIYLTSKYNLNLCSTTKHVMRDIENRLELFSRKFKSHTAQNLALFEMALQHTKRTRCYYIVGTCFV